VKLLAKLDQSGFSEITVPEVHDFVFSAKPTAPRAKSDNYKLQNSATALLSEANRLYLAGQNDQAREQSRPLTGVPVAAEPQ
jgi:hypothetical protein